MYLDYTFGDTDDQNVRIDVERYKCHLNLAAVRLETGQLREAINEARLAINLEPESSKAHYRRGNAHLRLGELEEAQRDLYKAMKLASSESKDVKAPIEDAIRELNVKWRDYRKKSADLAKAAIG